MSKKVLALLFSTLIIALPGGLGRAAGRWKTYRNKKLKFQVACPARLEPQATRNVLNSVGFIGQKFIGTDCSEFQVQVEPRGSMNWREAVRKSGLFLTKKEAESFYTGYPRLGPFPFPKAPDDAYFIGGGIMDPAMHPVKKITINGYPALSGETEARCYYNAGGIAGSGPVRAVFLLGKHYYAAINIMWPGSDSDKMLSSFKFIQP